MRKVTLQPETKLLPLIVKGCALLAPTGEAGLTLLIEGGDTGACTVKVNWPEDWPFGLITSTVQVAAAVVKFGLMVMAVVLNELCVRLA